MIFSPSSRETVPKRRQRRLNSAARRGNLAFSPGTAPGNLNRAQRPGLIQNADDWPAMRLTRNRHFKRLDAMPPALKRARDFVDTLCAAHHAIRRYAQARFDIPQRC